MSKVSREIAEQEITKWLDHRRVDESSRLDYKGFCDKLVSAIERGVLILDEKFNLVFTPVDPVKNEKGETTVTDFKFKPRVRMKELRPYLSGVKSGDGDGRLLAYICALTYSSSNIIDELDSRDFAICEAIAIFFV